MLTSIPAALGKRITRLQEVLSGRTEELALEVEHLARQISDDRRELTQNRVER